MEDVTEKSTVIAGLPGAVMRSLERIPIRMRESGVTGSEWQMTIDSDAGPGTITLADVPGDSVYRGEGAFLELHQLERRFGGWRIQCPIRVRELLHCTESTDRSART